jgi:hypothetical protein
MWFRRFRWSMIRSIAVLARRPPFLLRIIRCNGRIANVRSRRMDCENQTDVGLRSVVQFQVRRNECKSGITRVRAIGRRLSLLRRVTRPGRLSNNACRPRRQAGGKPHEVAATKLSGLDWLITTSSATLHSPHRLRIPRQSLNTSAAIFCRILANKPQLRYCTAPSY